jgi:hypothetical protein
VTFAQVHAAGCLSAIIVGPTAFNVYVKLDPGLDVKRLNCCVAISLSDAQGYYATSHSYLLEGPYLKRFKALNQ